MKHLKTFQQINESHEKMYMTLTEENDWEGETWRFYIESTPENTEKMGRLKGILERFDLPFSVDMELKPQSEVDIMIKNAGGSYMISDSIGELNDKMYKIVVALSEGKNPEAEGLGWMVSFNDPYESNR